MKNKMGKSYVAQKGQLFCSTFLMLCLLEIEGNPDKGVYGTWGKNK